MKATIAITLFISASLSILKAADEPVPEFPIAAQQIIKGGVRLDTDLKKFLLVASTWTWEHPGANNEIITFLANGVVKQSYWVGKWTVTNARSVTIRIPSYGVSKLKFSDDLKSYTAIHNKLNPIEGKFVK